MKYVIAKTLKSGQVSYYWNPPKKVQALGFDPERLGSSYRKAKERADELYRMLVAARQETQRGLPQPGTVRWVLHEYKKDDLWKDLDASTQRVYEQALRRIEDSFGRYRIEAVKYQHAKAFYLKERAPTKRTGGAERFGQSASIIRVARVVWEYADREGYCSDNPFSKVRIKKPENRQAKWTREQVYKLIEVAEANGHWGIATAVLIAFELCQRQADVMQLSDAHFTSDQIQVRQNKTDALIWVPLDEVPEFRARIIEAIRRSSATLVTQPDGTPWRDNMNQFRHEFSRLKTLASIPKRLTFQDLRRSGLSEIGDAGGTTDEMRSLSGHKTREILAAYVVPSTEQARNALRKREAYRKLPKHASDDVA
ncbi:MAG TPA: tyrosine-type recombinase/integrase [Anaerolineales bacterium]|jgi:hypothetical protein